MISTIKNGFYKIDKFIAIIETTVLCLTLTFLFVVGFYQVTARELAGAGAMWPEHLLRYSVLIIGFLGASLAVRENRNIKIDLITHFLAAKGQNRLWQAIEGCLFLIGSAISLFLIKACWDYIKMEQMLGAPIPNTNIQAYFIFFVPIVFFGLSGIRYFFYGIFKFLGYELETDSSSGV